MRRVCVTNIVAQPHGRNHNDGSWNSTQFLMAVLVAALAAAAFSLGAMLGWRLDV